MIDGIAAIILSIVVGFLTVVGLLTFGSDLGLSDETLSTLGDLVLLFFLFVVFLGPFIASAVVGVLSGLLGKGTGTTPGRRICRLRVVDAADGQPSRGRAALHGLLRHVPTTLVFVGIAPVFVDGDPIGVLTWAGCVLLIVDVVVLLVRDDDRALHDVIAGVRVVRQAPQAPATVTLPG